MAGEIRCFVNDAGISVAAGSTVLDAVRAADPLLADRIAAGEGQLTDGRGIALAATAPAAVGSIIRAIVSARRGARTAEFDALP